MPFIPNELDAFHASQASPDAGHLDALRDGAKATGVVSGCAVTAQGTPDTTVAVAAGVIAVAGAKAYVTAGNLTCTADGTNPRFYIIVVSSAGVKSAVAGTPAPEMAPGVRGPAFPAIPANSVLLASVYVPANDTTLAQNQIGDHRVFVVPPPATTNYDLAKARSIPLVKERSQAVTLDAGEQRIHEIIKVGSRLFGVCHISPTKLIRFNNLEDLTDRTVHTYVADGFHDGGHALVYVAETNRVYVLFEHASRTTVAEVNPDTMATTDVISDTSHPAGDVGNGGSLTASGTHLFVSTSNSPCVVIKYQLSDFAFVDQVTLTGLNNGHASVYDGDRVYIGGSATPAWVAKVNPTDLTFTSVSWPTGVGLVTHPGLASDGDYLWVGTEGSAGPWLHRLNKADLTIESFGGVNGPTVAAIHHDGKWLWVAISSSPGKLMRVDPKTGQMAVHTFASGENHAYAMASDGERLFIVFWLPNPAIVKRLVPPAHPTSYLTGSTLVQAGGSISSGGLIGVQSLSHVVDGNVGTSEEILLSSSVTADTLNADKKALRITATGRFAANANAKRILLKFGLGAPVAVFDTGSLLFNDAQWWLEAICVRTGSNAQDWVTKWTSDSSLLATKVSHTTTTQTDTGALVVSVRGVGVSANDTTNELLVVEVLN